MSVLGSYFIRQAILAAHTIILSSIYLIVRSTYSQFVSLNIPVFVLLGSTTGNLILFYISACSMRFVCHMFIHFPVFSTDLPCKFGKDIFNIKDVVLILQKAPFFLRWSRNSAFSLNVIFSQMELKHNNWRPSYIIMHIYHSIILIFSGYLLHWLNMNHSKAQHDAMEIMDSTKTRRLTLYAFPT